MDEAEFLCDEIGIMDHGQIIARGSPRELLQEYCKNVVVVIPRGPAADYVMAHQDLFGKVHASDQSVEVQTVVLNQVLAELGKQSFDLSGINIRQSNLDDLFLEMTGKGMRS